MTSTEEEADAVAGLRNLTCRLAQRILDIGLVLLILL